MCEGERGELLHILMSIYRPSFFLYMLTPFRAPGFQEEQPLHPSPLSHFLLYLATATTINANWFTVTANPMDETRNLFTKKQQHLSISWKDKGKSQRSMSVWIF